MQRALSRSEYDKLTTRLAARVRSGSATLGRSKIASTESRIARMTTGAGSGGSSRRSRCPSMMAVARSAVSSMRCAVGGVRFATAGAPFAAVGDCGVGLTTGFAGAAVVSPALDVSVDAPTLLFPALARSAAVPLSVLGARCRRESFDTPAPASGVVSALGEFKNIPRPT